MSTTSTPVPPQQVALPVSPPTRDPTVVAPPSPPAKPLARALNFGSQGGGSRIRKSKKARKSKKSKKAKSKKNVRRN